MPADDHDLGARGQVGAVQHAQARVGHVLPQRVRADHERGAARARLGEQVLHGAADGHDVAHRGADADLPQPGHVVLGRAARVVRRVGHLLAGVAQRLDRLHGARRGLVADPDAAVQIQDELVVATGQGGQRHVASLRRPCRGSSSLLGLALALALGACGGDDDETASRAAARAPAADDGARRGAAGGRARTSSSRAPRDGRRRRRSREPLDAGQDLRGRARDELRRVHDPARPEDLARGGGLVRLARAQRLLRRHDLPPDRPRLRDPGRRPDRQRQRRARLLDERRASRRTRPTSPGVVAMAKAGNEPPGTGGQPVLRRHRRRHRA